MPAAAASRASSPDPRQLLDREFVGMLRSVRRFHRLATTFLEQTTDDDTTTYGELVREGGFPESFVRLYAVPLVACVWSSGAEEAIDYPARYLFRFLEHHGMLTVGDSPQWMTVVGGSRTYVDALAERLPAVRSGDPVTSVLRGLDGVEVRTGAGRVETYDRVVLALHADDALGILADPTPAEKEVLGAFRYSQQRDRAPPRRLADAAGAARPLVVELPRRRRPVTRRGRHLLDEPPPGPARATSRSTSRSTPPTGSTPRASSRRCSTGTRSTTSTPCGPSAGCPSSTTERTAFAGAYHGWGFHEDGCRSGVEAAAAFGVTW